MPVNPTSPTGGAYRSEVRESLIRNLKEKVEGGGYKKYLHSMTLHKLRAFRDATIRFRFPVTALIGPNGGGKSTVLGASALIYRECTPSSFFAVSSVDQEAMKDVRVAYRLIDREKKREGEIERSVTHPKSRWNREALQRKILFFGVKRALPAGEQSEFTKFRLYPDKLTEEDYAVLDSAVIEHASRILGVDLSRYSKAASKKPMIGFAGPMRHSQFHFGAGISVIIELVAHLEQLSPEDQALVLIEEIETTLHPFAVRKLVEYLVGVADRKRCQIIFTTHSEYALDPLPREAIWAARGGELVNGRLRVQDVLAIRGESDTKLVIYAEDSTAIAWIQGMMRFSGMTDEMSLVEFYPIGSHSAVVQHTEAHNQNPSKRFPAIGFVDGDTPTDVSLPDKVFRLPGNLMPEEVILDAVREGYPANLGVLTVALNRRPDEQELVRRVIESEAMGTSDMHLVFSKIGQRLGFVPEETVRLAMISAYCHTQQPAARHLSATVNTYLVQNGNGTIH